MAKQESLVMSPTFRPDVVQTFTDADFQTGGSVSARRELPRRVTAIRLQIIAIQIMGGLSSIMHRQSGVYVISTVADGIDSMPINLHGKNYEGLKDGDLLPLGPTNDPKAVFNVYLRERQLPRAVAFCLLVARSEEKTRNIGSAISQATSDDRYKKLLDVVKTAVTSAAPAYGVLLQAGLEAVELIAECLKMKPDKQLGYYQAMYTNRFDNLGLGRHPAQHKHFRVGNVRLAYQIDAS